MNTITLQGCNLGKINDLRTTASGKKTWSFTVSDQISADKTNWFRVVLWEDYAVKKHEEITQKMAQKKDGEKIIINATGRIIIDEYNDKNTGEKKKSYDINVNFLQVFICNKATPAGAGGAEMTSANVPDEDNPFLNK